MDFSISKVASWLIPTIIALFVSILGLGKGIQTISSNKKEIEGIKDGLKQPDGTTTYILRSECALNIKEFGEKIDEVKEVVNAADRKSTAAKEFYVKEMSELWIEVSGELRIVAEFMGATQQFMKQVEEHLKEEKERRVKVDKADKVELDSGD